MPMVGQWDTNLAKLNLANFHQRYCNLNRAPSTSKRRVDQGSSGVGKVVSSSSWQGGPEDKPVAGEYTCNCN